MTQQTKMCEVEESSGSICNGQDGDIQEGWKERKHGWFKL